MTNGPPAGIDPCVSSKYVIFYYRNLWKLLHRDTFEMLVLLQSILISNFRTIAWPFHTQNTAFNAKYSLTCITRSHLGKEKVVFQSRWHPKRASIHMNLSMTGQEKCDLSIHKLLRHDAFEMLFLFQSILIYYMYYLNLICNT